MQQSLGASSFCHALPRALTSGLEKMPGSGFWVLRGEGGPGLLVPPTKQVGRFKGGSVCFLHTCLLPSLSLNMDIWPRWPGAAPKSLMKTADPLFQDSPRAEDYQDAFLGEVPEGGFLPAQPWPQPSTVSDVGAVGLLSAHGCSQVMEKASSLLLSYFPFLLITIHRARCTLL